jgi:hypothetical protein
LKERSKLDRREFTSASLLALLGGVTVTVSGCGGGSSGGGGGTGGGGLPGSYDSPTLPGPTTTDGVTGTITSNHGHSATISAAELNAGDTLTLDITGDSDHPHTVELTAPEVQSVASGDRVTKRSSNDDSHFHEVTFN